MSTSTASFNLAQFSSVAQLCPTLCDPVNRGTPGLPVHHQLPEFTQTHAHQVGDAIQPSHPLSSPSPPAPNPSQHQGLFQWANSLHEVAKVLEWVAISSTRKSSQLRDQTQVSHIPGRRFNLWATRVWPQVNNREGTQPHPLTENCVKDLLSMALPIRTRPSFPLCQSLPSGSFHKPLILLHQRADRLKTTITEN